VSIRNRRGGVRIKADGFKKPGKKSDPKSPVLKLELNELQREVLLKTCKIYRAKMPSYLRSIQNELRIIDELIEKLT